MQANIYIEADSKAPRRKKRKYGYVLECICRGQTRTVEQFDSIEETFHGTMVTALEKALIRFNKPCEITVHAPDAWLLDMMENQLEKWAAGDFLNSQGRPISYQKQWMHIWLLAKQHEIYGQRGSHEYSAWMKEEMNVRSREDLSVPGADPGRGGHDHQEKSYATDEKVPASHAV